MVQEFHVLRCFSCQTFQVQQVKKSKKWECKVCGEKQSVIKEYGRGAAADCRRHVQKLNSLRGELLEVNREKVLSQWEQDKDYQNASVSEDLDAHHQSEEVSTVSRWSKYIDQTAKDSKQEEDENEEEENIHMERERFRNQGPRKRKLVSKFKSVNAPSGNFEQEESWTSSPNVKSHPYQTSRHDRKLSSSSSNGYFSKNSHHNNAKDVSSPSTHLPSSPQAVSSYHTTSTSFPFTAANSSKCQQNSSHTQPGAEVLKHLPLPNKSISAPSSNQKFESKFGSKDSKWSKFLTVVPTQEEDDGVEDHLSKIVPESTDLHYEELRCPLVGETETGRQMSVGDVCVDKNASPSYAFSSEQDVCQPPITKRPCPGLSLNSLFFTDEDFDETF